MKLRSKVLVSAGTIGLASILFAACGGTTTVTNTNTAVGNSGNATYNVNTSSNANTTTSSATVEASFIDCRT